MFGRLCVTNGAFGCLFAITAAATLTMAEIASADDLTDQVNNLTNKLKPSVNTADGKLRDAINNLSQAIGQIDCSIVPGPEECISNLKSAVAALQKALPTAPGPDTTQWTDINTQINVLVDLLSGANPTVAATATANNLTARLGDTSKPVNPKDKNLTDALGALSKAIDKLVPPKPASPAPLLINVLGSYYGSLDDLMSLLCVREKKEIEVRGPHNKVIKKVVQKCEVDERNFDLSKFESALAATPGSEVKASFGTPRYCSATQAIRAQCQGKATCLDNPSPSTLVAAQLCGFDPAPYAQPVRKGLLISYQCVPKDSKQFPYADGFLPQQIPPPNSNPVNPVNSVNPIKWVLLRLNESLKIACSDPPSQTQPQTQNQAPAPAPAPKPAPAP